jgi:hypothetical protein
MLKRKVVFTDNDGCSQAFIYDALFFVENGVAFYKKDNCILFLPSWCAFATLDYKTEIPESLCLPSQK